MLVFNRIIELSKKLAASLLKDKKALDIEDIEEHFNKDDATYILKQLTKDSLILERQQLKKQINPKADFKKIESRINPPVKRQYWKYAAAASLIGVLITVYFFKDKVFTNPEVPREIHIVNQNVIQPGTDKATLTLEDGSHVALEKGKVYKTSTVKSNGSKLLYETSNTTTEIAYNYLTIPRGGQFYLELSDGTRVWLNSETQLKYPVAFIKGVTREVELVYGEAYFDVSPSVHNDGARFKVLNKNQDIEVLGTAFNIKAYKDEANTYTTLVEGKVTVNSGTQKQYLLPGQQSDLDRGSHVITTKTVDVYNEISWKEGIFSFENKDLKDIMKVLSRWYDVEIAFANKSAETKAFNGILDKNQTLKEILEIIKNFKILNSYEIEQNRVILK